jgi:hypothetical protein
MTAYRKVVRKIDDFDMALTLTTTPQGEFGWRSKTTHTSGTPTAAVVADSVAGSALKIALDTTSEVQVETAYQNDVLVFLLAELQLVEFVAKVSGVASASTLLFGIATAENDTPASVTNYAWFKLIGGTSTSELYVDSSDGTHVNTSVDTLTTLGSVYKKCAIDFTNGLKDVRFYVDGARVCASTTFDLSAASAGQGVQLYLQVGKSSAADAPALYVTACEIQYRVAGGQ